MQTKLLYITDICIAMFMAAVFTQPKVESTQTSIGRLIDKICYTVLKRKEILICVATWMNDEDTVLRGIRQSQKEK